MRKLFLMAAVFGAGVFAYNCGGGSGSAGSGTVALYVTDSPLEDAGKVEVAIKEIRMEHKGSGTTCTVFAPDTPYTVDLTDIKNTLELLDLTSCPEGPYNRLVVVLDKDVNVLYNDELKTCTLVDYDPDRDGQDKPIKPNRTQCDDNECFVYVTGAVNVLANQTNDVALDFELKDSEINIDNSGNCTVAFKVSPLHAEGMKDKEQEVKGFVSALDTDTNTFNLTTKVGTVFTVSYTDDSNNYDDVLSLAQSYNLKTEVECEHLDLENATCTAQGIEVKVKGIAVSVDDSNKTLILDIDGNRDTTDDQIQVSGGKWEGNIQEGSYVEVEIIGYDGTYYLAKEVEEEKS
ncbi:uncharacterized protein DUF4382 [Hydrogenivirga caldilitoris]|uniref:Uncharacterized protein DUF4382 n=1 Tax=Hydrogenivirga caldilitoris TaxID=246264 RepID=A0A497XQU1_9AQUI|nr:DUF4382 domain-containing protein [Hydrogenivirga caldilitoris]RLJ70509.1 uncharacterized protein DUF4382 [Hydrogenivirga caldilitoris]